VAKGNDFATAEKTKLLNSYLTENQVFNFKGDKFLQIESLKRDESIWIYFEAQVSANAPIGTPRFECFTKIKRYENGSDSRKQRLIILFQNPLNY
jgi:hypothetical protein